MVTLKKRRKNMRSSLIILSAFTSCLVSSVIMAATQNTKIVVYQSPKMNTTVIEKLNPGEHLVGIFQQGDWIKVGDPRNGQTGWVNRDQYQQAMNQYFQSNMQT